MTSFSYYRNVYHCPFCNLCRIGKGLGIDYFHCMTCNCCLSMRLLSHKCKENCLEPSCLLCHEFLFTSTAPVRALPCGHFIHSTCYKVIISISISWFLSFFQFGISLSLSLSLSLPLLAYCLNFISLIVL